mmetsp:Transcript_61728/g.145191  ORF Transcript_61728/g.145191 Transcript_61728/m.145191 type:complete len:257 (-) Transcript_61728:378-1148(-)
MCRCLPLVVDGVARGPRQALVLLQVAVRPEHRGVRDPIPSARNGSRAVAQGSVCLADHLHVAHVWHLRLAPVPRPSSGGRRGGGREDAGGVEGLDGGASVQDDGALVRARGRRHRLVRELAQRLIRSRTSPGLLLFQGLQWLALLERGAVWSGGGRGGRLRSTRCVLCVGRLLRVLLVLPLLLLALVWTLSRIRKELICLHQLALHGSQGHVATVPTSLFLLSLSIYGRNFTHFPRAILLRERRGCPWQRAGLGLL